MINLLPVTQKSELLAKRSQKLVAVLALICLVSLTCFVLMLASLYLYALAGAAYHDDRLQSTKQTYETVDFKRYRDIIRQSNRALAKVNAFYKQEVNFTSALKIMAGIQKPGDLQLTAISLETTGASSLKVAVFGEAKTREGLLVFRDSIQKEGRLSSVYFPPDNWIKPKDIHFSFTALITQ